MTHILTFKGPLKQGLGRMIAEDPSIQATVSEFFRIDANPLLFENVFELSRKLLLKVLGVRDGDPGSSYISTFSPTDGDWPKV